MKDICPTVRVVSPESPGGFKLINESDLTPEHEIWQEQKVHARERGEVLDLNPSAKKNR